MPKKSGVVGRAVEMAAGVGRSRNSIVVSLALVWMPSGVGLIFAGLAAMAVGAECERRGFGP